MDPQILGEILGSMIPLLIINPAQGGVVNPNPSSSVYIMALMKSEMQLDAMTSIVRGLAALYNRRVSFTRFTRVRDAWFYLGLMSTLVYTFDTHESIDTETSHGLMDIDDIPPQLIIMDALFLEDEDFQRQLPIVEGLEPVTIIALSSDHIVALVMAAAPSILSNDYPAQYFGLEPLPQHQPLALTVKNILRDLMVAVGRWMRHNAPARLPAHVL